MFVRRRVDGFAQRDRFHIIAAADFGFVAIFQRTQKLRHCANECVGEPHFGPARLVPGIRLTARAEVECTRRALGITWPTDDAARQPLGALDTPMDANVAGAALAGWASPDIVPSAGAAAIVIFKYVQIDAVAVREARARIGSCAGQYAVGSAEPIAEGVEMMDAHHERRE